MVNKRQRHARSRHAPLHLATNPANDICQRAEHFIGISSTGEADSLPRSSNVMLQQCSAREAASCNYLLRPTAATRARTVSRPLQLRRCTSVLVSMHTQWGSNHYFLPNCATALELRHERFFSPLIPKNSRRRKKTFVQVLQACAALGIYKFIYQRSCTAEPLFG